jgi:hypothetical protein
LPAALAFRVVRLPGRERPSARPIRPTAAMDTPFVPSPGPYRPATTKAANIRVLEPRRHSPRRLSRAERPGGYHGECADEDK